MTGMAISFTLILARIIRAGLTYEPVSRTDGCRAIRRFGVGCLIYPAVTAIGLLSPVTVLALYAALTLFYIFEQTPVLSHRP